MSAAEREFEFTSRDFNFLRDVANRHTGIVLGEDKFNMLYSRLSRRIRSLGLGSFKQYCNYLQENESTESVELVNAVTTNLTSFFREKHHFDYLAQTLMPKIIRRNQNTKRIRVWSSASSTGEEPYSIAMALKQAHIPKDWDVKILATDIDRNVLAHGAKGLYTNDRIKGLPESLVKKWFKPAGPNHVQVDRELISMISYKHLNLLHDWPFNGPFDAIFCRNVIIYFDAPTKKKLVERYCDYMHDQSCLFLGHSESLFRVTTKFKSLGHTVYERENNAT